MGEVNILGAANLPSPLLQFFGSSPTPYYLLALTCLFIFLAVVSLPERATTGNRWFDLVPIAAAGMTLWAWRWPTFLWQDPLNPDEALWVAGGLKMTADWVPWRGFDGATSGPISAYVLALPALLGRPVNFFSARLLCVFLLTGALAALYYSVKWLHGRRVARMALVPPTLLLAVTKDWNFLHFSSEIVPVFLTSVALAAGVYLTREEPSGRCRAIAIAIAGLCIGSSGLAKLQSIPIACMLLLLTAVAIMWRHRRAWQRAASELALLTAFTCLLPAAIAAVLLITGVWEYAILSYFRGSVGYIGEGIRIGPSFLFAASSSYSAFLISSIIASAGAGAIYLFNRADQGARRWWLLGASALLLFASGVAMYAPRRPFAHYLLFSVVPLSWCLAHMLGLASKTNLWRSHGSAIVLGYIAVFFLPPVCISMSSAPPAFVTEIAMNATWRGGIQARTIARYARRGASVAIWGAAAEYYVQTGTIMATRYGQMSKIPPGPHQKYYEDRILQDLEASKPAVFVDAVHPGAFRFHDRKTEGYESFPELAAYVQAHYLLKEDLHGVRVFVLKNQTGG